MYNRANFESDHKLHAWIFFKNIEFSQSPSKAGTQFPMSLLVILNKKENFKVKCK